MPFHMRKVFLKSRENYALKYTLQQIIILHGNYTKSVAICFATAWTRIQPRINWHILSRYSRQRFCGSNIEGRFKLCIKCSLSATAGVGYQFPWWLLVGQIGAKCSGWASLKLLKYYYLLISEKVMWNFRIVLLKFFYGSKNDVV